MADELTHGQATALTSEIELLRTFKPYAALRNSLDWRFPGTHGIGPFVPLRGLTGYSDDVARDIVETATAGLGLRFGDQQVAAFGTNLADLADLIDHAIAGRLNRLVRRNCSGLV
ncbi:hypothetical protein [Gordonia rubripertincta]|uniref:Uncharacterized protein n=1 Tax=Gordonia rubripertincta TaxID=36822 RepID=A0ABT4MVM3_GORRU|nr:hypothetical protein [Gordonia rubripertincta]MCZ4549802.1 hypothetical protein [Gordonia rubripertincta]